VDQFSITRNEINDPLETLTNLVYLTRHEANNPVNVIRYMVMAEVALGELTLSSRKLTFRPELVPIPL
jgi:hypothetical protein